MTKFTRKQFIKTSSGAVLAATVAPFSGFKNSTVAPSDTVSIGLIGVGRSMGISLLTHALKIEGVNCKAMCDVDKNFLEEKLAIVEEITGNTPAVYNDYRRLLEDDDLDAVIIATPDHWHCLNMIHSLEAGKHVYVEKPLANSIAEIDVMKKAADRYGKVVQVGQQQRSGKHWQEIVNLIQSGHMGRIRSINVWGNFGYGLGPEHMEDEPVPDGIDYDMWLGPAPSRPFNRIRFHRWWRFFWEFGGGLLTDWGTHLLDIALWAMNVDGPPKSVRSIGGNFSGMNRPTETPDTLTTIFEFEHFNMVWQNNAGLDSGPYNLTYGIEFVGNNGTLVVNRDGWKVTPVYRDNRPVIDKVPLQESVGTNHDLHVANFINGIRHGVEQNCPIEAGHLSAYYAQCGNIAYRTGETLKWNEEWQLIDQDKYSHLIKPEYRGEWQFPQL